MQRGLGRVGLVAAAAMVFYFGGLQGTLQALSVAVALIFLTFGFLNTLKPALALSFFTVIEKPRAKKDQAALNVLLAVAGAKNLYIGLSLLASIFYVRDTRLTGVMIVASGLTAAIDGTACKVHYGRGEWDHWGHGLGIFVLGLAVLGLS